MYFNRKNMFWRVRLQLVQAGIDVNYRDENGRTILGVLVNANNDNKAEWIEKLVAAGADLHVINHRGETLLHELLNSYNGDIDVIQYFIDAGFDVNARDIDGRTPLMGLKNDEAVELLIKSGADVNASDHQGRTPLMFSITNNIVDLLLKHGANANARDHKGRTHLMYNPYTALQFDKSDVDMNARDEDGRTMLMYLGSDRYWWVESIIEWGADVNIKDNYGKNYKDYPYGISIDDKGNSIINKSDNSFSMY